MKDKTNPPNATPDATVVIATKNRKDDLRKAIQSAISQEGNVEVLVIDDGSTDGTAEMIQSQFSGVILDHHSNSRGYIPRRNRGAKLASGKYIFSIDDDAEFSGSKVVSDTIKQFENCPLAGAIAIPCIDVNRSSDLRQPKPDDGQKYATSEFIGTAYAVRKELFLEIGGFRESLIHQGEERDFSIRLLDRRYVVMLGDSAPIHHFESPKRDTSRMDYFGRRNDVLFAWCNAPLRWLPIHLLATTFKGLIFGFKCGRPVRMLRGLFGGWLAIPATARCAVSSETYQLYRNLRTRKFLSIQEIEGAHLNAPQPVVE